MITPEQNKNLIVEISNALNTKIKETIIEKQQLAVEAEAAGKKAAHQGHLNAIEDNKKLAESISALNPSMLQTINLPEDFNEQLTQLGALAGFKFAKQIGDLVNAQAVKVRAHNVTTITKAIQQSTADMRKASVSSQVIPNLIYDFDKEGNPVTADTRLDKALTLLQVLLNKEAEYQARKTDVAKTAPQAISPELQQKIDLLKNKAHSKGNDYITASLRQNIKLITTSLEQQEHASQTIEIANTIKESLSSATAHLTDFDLSKIDKIIDGIIADNTKILNKANNNLEGFNLDSVIETITKAQENNNQEPAPEPSNNNIVDTPEEFLALLEEKKAKKSKNKKQKTEATNARPTTLEGINLADFLTRTGEFTQIDSNALALNFEEYMQDPKYREMQFIDFLNKIKNIELTATQIEALNAGISKVNSNTIAPESEQPQIIK